MSRQTWRTILFLLVFLFIVMPGLWLYRVTSHGLAIVHITQQRLAWAQQLTEGNPHTAFSPDELDHLEEDLSVLEKHLRSLRNYLRPVLFIMQKADRLPVIGADVQAAPHILDLSIELIAVAREGMSLARAYSAADARQVSSTAHSSIQTIIEAVRTHESRLQTAHRHLIAARSAREAIRGHTFATPIRDVVPKLDRYLPLLEWGLLGAQAMPALLGDTATYLVLAQNNDELRATGGFISGIGVVTVAGGRITSFSLRDSYGVDDLTIDHPVPPEPLLRYMRIGVLLMRDANWWPDFPTSAAMLMRLWQQDQGQQVDGVIAVDLEGMRLLVEGLGPIPVEGEAQPVEARGLVDKLRERWGTVPVDLDERYQWWLGRKDFFALLAKSAIAKVQDGLGAQDILPLARSLKAAVDGKHVMIYSTKPSLRVLLADLGADGAILPTRSDYLMVVDTNMGFNKVNPRIDQRIEYMVDLASTPRTTARLTVYYTHTSTIHLAECIHAPAYGRTYADMMERCYWDYVRIYAPYGSTAILGPVSPHAETAPDGDKETFATFFSLAPGQAYRLALDYLLPPGIFEQRGKESRYSLLVQKQPGARPLPLRVAVVLPLGATLTMASPQPDLIVGNVAVFDALLDRDRRIEVRFAR